MISSIVISTSKRLLKASSSWPKTAFRALSTSHDHLVIALGGNALLKRQEKMTLENQRHNIRQGLTALHNILNDFKVTLVHGNGPQVGLLALESAAYEDATGVPAMQLDVLDAESEGMIGYLLEQEIHAHVPPTRGVATILTQMIVDPQDPAFGHPTKFIGPVYTLEQAQSLQRPFLPDGKFYRRVVPSPLPVKMVDQQFKAVQQLLDNNCLVICAGGGGIPVVGPDQQGRYRGVEAVIDKDRAASWVGQALGAQGLLILTDVSAAALDYGTDHEQLIQKASPQALASLSSHFPAGSMGPKVEAAVEFVQRTNGWAAIGSLNEADQIMKRQRGTWIEPHPNGHVLEFHQNMASDKRKEATRKEA